MKWTSCGTGPRLWKEEKNRWFGIFEYKILSSPREKNQALKQSLFIKATNDMAIYLTTARKKDTFSEFGGDAANTGGTESQVALMTLRINELSKHLQTNAKDNSCKRSLLTMVGQRKRLLHYLMKKDIQRYREIIEKLGIRK